MGRGGVVVGRSGVGMVGRYAVLWCGGGSRVGRVGQG